MEGRLEIIVLVLGMGILAQWLAWRLKLPAIVLLSGAGILAGPVFQVFNPTEDLGEFRFVLIQLAVAVILFEGGMNLRFHELRTGTGRVIRRLVSVGIPLAWVLGALAAHYIVGLSVPVSLVLASILVVTGPTVIMPLIRQTRLAPKAASLLKWEGIINDPIGALLTVLTFEYFVVAESAGTAILTGLGSAILVSAALGIGVGYFLKIAFSRGWIPEFLKVPSILCLTMVIYGTANLVQDESGLLAVTIFGIVVGNIGFRMIHGLRRFKENIAIFLVSTVFIVLTAELRFEDLGIINWKSLLFFIAILFVVRPLSVWLATLRSDISRNERVLLAWIAPRGIVAASVAGLFGPRLVELGYADASLLVPIVFSMVLITVVLHGISIGPLAKRLRLSAGPREGILIVGASAWSTEFAGILQSLDIPVLLVDKDWQHLRKARLRGIPSHYGEILSEESEESLDYTQMGYLLAVTDNDAYNALVCSEFSPHFGQERVFQIAMDVESQKDVKALRGGSRGRIAFGEHMRFETLLSRYYLGWRFQKTSITDAFKYDDFQKTYGSNAEPLFLLRKNGSIVFDTSRKNVSPEAGDIIVSYAIPNKTESQGNSN